MMTCERCFIPIYVGEKYVEIRTVGTTDAVPPQAVHLTCLYSRVDQ